MKISTSLPSIGLAPDAGRTKPTSVQRPPNEGAGARVDISLTSARLQKVGAGETPFNAQRVTEIKTAIAAGRFQINPERIADGLLSSVREMLGRTAVA